MNSFLTSFKTKLYSDLQKTMNLTSPMQVPRLSKVVVSSGVGKFHKDDSKVKFVFDQIRNITGQHPVISKAKFSIAGFSTRQGERSGVFVTLRKNQMYNFLIKLTQIAMPRIDTFKGLSPKKFDGKGNMSFGIKQQDIFLESSVEMIIGMNICIVTTANNDKDAQHLLSAINLPFI